MASFRLLSGLRFDEGSGKFTGGNGRCNLNGNAGRIVGKGQKWDDYNC